MKLSVSRLVPAMISLGIGFFFLFGSWGAYLDYNRVTKYNGRASGQITKKHFQAAADGAGNYRLDYWFVSSKGSKINASSDISKQQWDTLQVNDKLEIRYDPSNPNRNIPMYGGSPSLILAFFMLVLGAIFLAFGALRFISGFKKGYK